MLENLAVNGLLDDILLISFLNALCYMMSQITVLEFISCGNSLPRSLEETDNYI